MSCLLPNVVTHGHQKPPVFCIQLYVWPYTPPISIIIVVVRGVVIITVICGCV